MGSFAVAICDYIRGLYQLNQLIIFNSNKMEKQEILDFVSENDIDKNSVVSVTIIENEVENTYRAKFEFNSKSELGIDEENVGMRIERIKDTLNATLLEPISLKDIISIEIV